MGVPGQCGNDCRKSTEGRFMSETTISFNHKEVAFRNLYNTGMLMYKGDLYEVEKLGLDLISKIKNKNTTIAELGHYISQKYNISIENSIEDVSVFINALFETGLILIDGKKVIIKSNGQITDEKNRMKRNDEFGYSKCWALAKRNQVPLKCKFNTTYRCNIACKYCYNGERPGIPGGDNYAKKTELSLTEIDNLFQEMYGLGTFFFDFAGGEPFARQDFDEILSLTDKYEFAVEISTNGTYVKEDVAKRLSEHRIQLVVVSMFSPNSSIHDAFTQVDGTFKRACNGIELLLKHGIEVGVRCSINKSNFAQWKELRNLVLGWGARYFPHTQVHLSSDRKVDTRHLRLDNDQLKEIFDEGITLNENQRCEVGFARVDIMPNGDVALCSLLTHPLGNIREQSFETIWKESKNLNTVRTLLGGEVNSCSGCKSFGEDVYRCTADALFDDGAFNVPSSEAIRVIRAYENTAKQSSHGELSKQA